MDMRWQSEWGTWPRNAVQQRKDRQFVAVRIAMRRARTIARVQQLADDAIRMRAELLIGPQHLQALLKVSLDRLATIRRSAAGAR